MKYSGKFFSDKFDTKFKPNSAISIFRNILEQDRVLEDIVLKLSVGERDRFEVFFDYFTTDTSGSAQEERFGMTSSQRLLALHNSENYISRIVNGCDEPEHHFLITNYKSGKELADETMEGLTKSNPVDRLKELAEEG